MNPHALFELTTDLVARVQKLDLPADALVSAFFRHYKALGSRERHTLAETAYAVLRRRMLYQNMAQSGHGPMERRLAMLAWQGQPDFLRRAITVDEQAWLNHVNAIDLSTLPDKLRHNLPDWIADAVRAQLGEEFDALAASLNQSAPVDVRVNTLKSSVEDVQAALKADGIESTKTGHSPWALRLQGKPPLSKVALFMSGGFEVQDEGSQLLALLTEARRGEMVVDFCAGAGGKTLALGAMMRNTGRLYAFDVSAHRLDALKPRLSRSGLSNVYPAGISHERDERVKRLAGKIDRVLVDAPCSGLGTLRRNPDLKWRQSPAAVEELVAKQTAILDSAARLLKSGGRLVYATCSLLRKENENIAEAFLAAHPEFEALDAAEVLARQKVANPAGLATNGYLRLWPHRHATDGFFAAVFQRR